MPPKRYHVFISHNSKDKAQIADLVKGLQRNGFEVWFDIDDIVAGENWEKQVLNELKDSKVCVVFFSEEGWGPHHLLEVKMAQKLSEIRIIPVFLPGAPLDNISLIQKFFEPSGLSEKTTYLDFRSQFNIQNAIPLLQKAILGEGKGLDWSVKLERDARNWENKRQSTYSGRLLKDAQEWGKKNPSEVSEKGWAFINASLAAQSARLRQIIIGLIFTISCITCLALFAVIQRNIAVSKENARATAQANAEAQRNIAVSNENARATAQANAEAQTNIALARQLAAQSQLTSLNAREDTILSGLLAIESLKRYPSLEGDLALNRVLSILGYPTTSMNIGDKVTCMAFSEDRNWLVTGNSDGIVQVWDIVAGQERTQLWQNAELVDVAFSPDRKLIISGDLDNTIYVWDEEQMEPVNIIRLDGSLGSFIVSPDGRSVATMIFLDTGEWATSIYNISTGSEEFRISTDTGKPLAYNSSGNLLAIYDINNNNNEGVLFIWDIKLKKEIAKFISNTSGGWVSTVQFSNNGLWVASGDQFGIVHIWNIETGEEILQENIGSSVPKLFFSPDDNFLAGTNSCIRKEICGTSISIWNVSTRQLIANLQQSGGINDIDISRDGKYLASAGGDGTARIWEISTGKELGRMLHASSVSKIAFSQEENSITSIDENGELKTWWFGSSSTGKYEIQENGIWVARMSPKADNFATINYDNIARVRNLATGQEISSIQLKSQVHNLQFSSDGNWIASPFSTQDGSIIIWDANTGKEVTRITHQGGISNVAFSPDNKWLASSGNYAVCIWELPSGKEKKCKQFDSTEFPYPPSELAFSPDGKSIAVTLGYSTQILDTEALQKIIEVSKGYATDPTFSPDGKLLATGELAIGFPACTYCSGHIWYISTGEEIFTLSPGGRVVSVEFSLNGQWLLTASQDGIARVWNVNTGQEVSKMIHNSSVDTATFNHDGSLVISGTVDGDVRIWEASTGRELARTKIEGASPSQGMQYVGFTNDSKTALLINGSGTIKLWVWQSQDLITELCSRLYRNMTQDEWKYYFGDEPYSLTCANLPSSQQ